jgi:hypothetical protein
MRIEPLPMVLAYLDRDPAATGLVRSMGGRRIQTAPNLVLDPAATLKWAAAQPVPAGVAVGDLTGAPAAGLVAACRDRYLWQHEGWCAAPVSAPLVTAHAEATVAATRRELSSGAWVGGQLAALASVVEESTGKLLIVSETNRRDERDGVALVAAVLADALRRLAAAGVGEVLLDGHVTDPHLHPVTATFPPPLRSDPLHLARLS